MCILSPIFPKPPFWSPSQRCHGQDQRYLAHLTVPYLNPCLPAPRRVAIQGPRICVRVLDVPEMLKKSGLREEIIDHQAGGPDIPDQDCDSVLQRVALNPDYQTIEGLHGVEEVPGGIRDTGWRGTIRIGF